MTISDLKTPIKRVSAQANLTPQPVQKPGSLLRKLGNFAGNTVTSITQPFASLAATPVQLGAKALGVPDPYAEGLPGLGDKRMPISPLTVGAKAGDALKAGSEIAAVATAPASIPAAMAVGAGIGAAQGAGTALQEQRPADQVAKAGALGAAVGGVAAGAFGLVGKLIAKAGDKIQMSIIRPTKADIEDGFALETVKKYKLGGPLNSTLDKTNKTISDLSTQLSQKLGSTDQRIQLSSVVDDTIKELTDSSKLRGFGANKKVLGALESLKEEVAVVGDDLTIPDAQIIKQAAGGFGAWHYGKPDPDSKATEIVYNTFYNKLKKAIEQSSPDGVRAINQELSKLIPVKNAILRRLPVAERTNLISLNDMIGLVGSSMSPIALGPTLLNIMSKSGNVGSALSRIGPVIQKSAVPTTGLLGTQISDNLQSGEPLSEAITPSSNINPEDKQRLEEISREQFDYVTEKIDPTGALGVSRAGVKVAQKVLADIHPDDLYILDRFIDYARLNKPISDAMFDGAEKLAIKFGISMDKGLAGVANEFEKVLTGVKHVPDTVFKQARDKVGRFK